MLRILVNSELEPRLDWVLYVLVVPLFIRSVRMCRCSFGDDVTSTAGVSGPDEDMKEGLLFSLYDSSLISDCFCR